jgi:glycine cleavage system H protein
MWPQKLKYSKTHEWARVEGDLVTMGITEFAVKHLSDLVFIDLPEVGEDVKQGESFAEIESVKAVADVYAVVSGEIVEVNEALSDEVEKISKDCYKDGWIVKIKMSDSSELNSLMDAAAYAKHAEAAEGEV